MSKRIILPVAALTLGLVVLASSAKQASAFSLGNWNPQTLIQKIAERFGLNQNEVQAVFDEAREEHQTQMQSEMQAKLEERLSQAVTDGQITEEQKQLILAKHEELKQKHQADFKNKDDVTREQWQQQRQAEREALEQWAADNGIDLKYFFGPMGQGMKGGPGMGMHRGFGPDQDE